MAHQSPMISIPKKTTDDVDWSTPIKNVITQSYGENPDNYTAECQSLQRCRQDAVKGAGSDFTARDLLYKYFGQLELLELRFPEIRVTFPWRDAFTNKLITQTSIAYEKASVLFQIASTHSSIAASQSRSDPEGVKRAFYYFRTSAGMLNYINENFLHAPSTDLSREVVKFLADVILAQATEVFFEKCWEEKKGNALVSKIAAQAAHMYSTLTEDVKEFMGKGIFDRNWVTVLQIKSKYFQSVAQYYRGLADDASGKHGDALVRFTLAESQAKEASKSAQSFSSMFLSTMSPTLSSDAGTSIFERAKAHHAICSEKKTEAQRENDLIYNAILPSPEALPHIDKTAVATAIHIHDVYAAPEVQKTIGQDFFIKLVPLSVHESASVYSEEKAKLVRGEVEKADAAEGEARSIVDGTGIREGLTRFKAMADGEVGEGEEIPLDVRRWKEDIGFVEEREGVQDLLADLTKAKENVTRDLDGIGKELEIESRECEMMRVKYEHLWTQDPSATLTKNMRQDLRSHLSSLEAAATSDQQVRDLWDSVRGDIQLLLSPEIEAVFRERGSGTDNLLDLDVSSEQDDTKERKKIGGFVDEIEERLTRLRKITKERNEVLRDLKEKIQADDVSHLLLLNRRNSGVEPTLFASELEKFRPYQQRLGSTVHAQDIVLQEISTLWKGLKDLAGKGPGARRWEEREKKKKDTVRRFSRARDGYMEVRDGIAKGLQFYFDLSLMTKELSVNVREYTTRRTTEREALGAKLETEKRLTAAASSSPPPKPPPPPGKSGLESALAGMSLRHSPTPSWQSKPPPPPPQQLQDSYHQYASSPPPPPPQNRQQFSPPPQQFPPGTHPPPLPSHFSPAPPPPQQQHPSYQPQFQQSPPPSQYHTQPPMPPAQSNYTFPPPPTSQPYGSNTYSSPAPMQTSSPSMFLPPPPPRPVQSSLASGGSGGNSAPQSDPFASLALLESQGLDAPTQIPGQTSTSTNSSSLPPPPPPQQQTYGYNSSFSQQQPYGAPSAPPPPPPQQYNHGGGGYASAPPPPPQQQYQQQPQQFSGYGNYSQQGYGGYGYGQ